MIGVRQYKDELREANLRIAELEACAAVTAGVGSPHSLPYTSGLSGTNAQKIAALEAIVGTLQARLRAAGLEWDV